VGSLLKISERADKITLREGGRAGRGPAAVALSGMAAGWRMTAAKNWTPPFPGVRPPSWAIVARCQRHHRSKRQRKHRVLERIPLRQPLAAYLASPERINPSLNNTNHITRDQHCIVSHAISADPSSASLRTTPNPTNPPNTVHHHGTSRHRRVLQQPAEEVQVTGIPTMLRAGPTG
jgi:hypothetical protein